MEKSETNMVIVEEADSKSIIPAQPYIFDDEDDDLGESLSKLPRYKIDKDTGKIVNDLTSDEVDSVNMVYLANARKRTHFNPTFGEEPSWFCMAVDFENGQLNEEELPVRTLQELKNACAGGACAKCKLKDWGKAGEKPGCSEVLSLMGFDFSSGVPFVIEATRTKMRPTAALLDQLILKKKHYERMNGLKLPSSAFGVKMSVEKRTDGTKKWFVPKFEITGETQNIETIKVILQLRQEYQPLFHSRISETPENEEDDVESPDREIAFTNSDMPF